jgi:hypothetical protein
VFLCGHALRLSNERFQVVDAHGPLHSSPLPMRTMSEMAILQQPATHLNPQLTFSVPEEPSALPVLLA